jgi:NitT/TauT family transport system substrate-binding protein
MLMPKKVLAAIVVAVVVISVLTGFWLIQYPPKGYRGPVEKLTVGAFNDEGVCLLDVAMIQGYFVMNGLDVTIKRYAAGRLAAEALLAGEVDISTTADFAFVTLAFNNSNLRVLATFDEQINIAVIARRDHGIGQPSDLQGKRIGVSKGTSAEFFLGQFLVMNGISLRDVEVVNVAPSGLVDAISNGVIDAVIAWQPYVYQMEGLLKSNAVRWSAQGGLRYYALLLSKTEWIETHRSTIERFLRAVVQAEQFVKSNDEQARRIVALQFGYDASYVDSVWKDHKFVVTLPQSLLLLMESEARWRIENRLTDKTKVPNYLEFIYFDGLEAVNPDAVTIIH